jgi:hypothetical protein
MEIRHGQKDNQTDWKTEAQAIFLHQFNVFSLLKRKFVVCPFVDEESDGSDMFAKQTKQT